MCYSTSNLLSASACLLSACIVVQFDMWEHKDKPPKGNDYGLLTRKVCALFFSLSLSLDDLR